jgi:hypothetical protein
MVTVTVVHGVFRCDIPYQGQTVEGVRQEAKEHLPISEGALVFVNGKPARPNHVLKKGDNVEFTIPDVQRNS